MSNYYLLDYILVFVNPLYKIFIGHNIYFQWLIYRPTEFFSMYSVVNVTLIILTIANN